MHVVLGYLLALLTVVPAVAHSNASQRPNFLLISVDDLAQDSLGVYGSPVANVTPNIDRFARQGMRFTNGHVTIAVCQPSRAVWMTGHYPHRSGAMGFEEIDAGITTLPEELRRAGFYNGIFGKGGHVVPSRAHAWDVRVNEGATRMPEQYYRLAKDFFKAAKQASKPFFLMANVLDPHRPFSGSADESKARRTLVRRTGLLGRTLDSLGMGFLVDTRYPAEPPSYAYTPEQVDVPGFLPDLPPIRQEVANYYTSVRRADEAVGAVLQALDEAGLADNTLVMFLSDNGASFPFAKANTYRHSTRAAWIVRWPGVVRAGSVDAEHLIGGVDLMPTVLDALGLPTPEGVDGRSFVPTLSGLPQAGFEQVFTYFFRTAGDREYQMRAVNTAGHGYIYNAWSDGLRSVKNESQAGLTWSAMLEAAADDPQVAARVQTFLYRTPEELYDYKADPHALANIVDDTASASVKDELRLKLLAHLRATKDPKQADFEAFLGAGSLPE